MILIYWILLRIQSIHASGCVIQIYILYLPILPLLIVQIMFFIKILTDKIIFMFAVHLREVCNVRYRNLVTISLKSIIRAISFFYLSYFLEIMEHYNLFEFFSYLQKLIDTFIIISSLFTDYGINRRSSRNEVLKKL